MRILITSAGGKLISKTVYFLKKDKKLNNIYVIGIDKKKIKKKIKYLDKFYSIKSSNEKQYINSVTKICKKHFIDIIIPLSDRESFLLSKNKRNFKKKNILVLVNKFKILKKISNKYLVYQELKKAGLNIPKYFLIKKKYHYHHYLKQLNFQNKTVVIKPVDGRGGRGVVFLSNKQLKSDKWLGQGKREKIVSYNRFNIDRHLKKYKELILMECLSPPAYDIDYFRHKKNKLISLRKRINPSGIPYKGNIVLRNKKIEDYCNKIANVLKIEYLVDFDLLYGENKKIVLLEINPRPSGSISVNNMANFPFLSYVLAKLLNKSYKISKITKSRKIIL